MTILAFDFSATQRSVAVWQGLEAEPVEVLDQGETRSLHPMTMVEEALRQANVGREAVECIAVGLGPGSYTGVRVSIAVAQGWQLAMGVKLVGLSTADGIASGLAGEGTEGSVSVVIDAQRGEFYLAGYSLGKGTAQSAAPLRLARREDVEARVAAGDVIVGPEVTRWFPTGRIAQPRAAVLARLATVRAEFKAGEFLEPIYLRETSFVKAPPPRPLPPLRS